MTMMTGMTMRRYVSFINEIQIFQHQCNDLLCLPTRLGQLKHQRYIMRRMVTGAIVR